MSSQQNTPTIISLKQSFLENQIRLLSQPMPPHSRWNEQIASVPDHDPLPAAAVDEALFRLNQTLQQHARRVFPPQSTRIVAEQIDKLYQVDDGTIRDEPEDQGPPAAGDDLTEEATIASLPPTWPNTRESDDLPMESNRYSDLTARLSALSSRRAHLRSRVDRLRRIDAAVRPFSVPVPVPDEPDDQPTGGGGGGGLRGVQENLVTRDGEVEKELERMRMLLARVGGRVAALPSPSPLTPNARADVDRDRDGDAELVRSPAMTDRDKIQRMLDSF